MSALAFVRNKYNAMNVNITFSHLNPSLLPQMQAAAI